MEELLRETNNSALGPRLSRVSAGSRCTKNRTAERHFSPLEWNARLERVSSKVAVIIISYLVMQLARNENDFHTIRTLQANFSCSADRLRIRSTIWYRAARVTPAHCISGSR